MAAENLTLPDSESEKLVFSSSLFYFKVAQIALPVFFISDILNKALFIVTSDDNPPFSPSKLIRMLFEIGIIFAIAGKLDKKRLMVLTMIIILFALFLIGVVVYLQNYTRHYPYIFHFTLFNKYIFIFIVYAFLYSVRDEPRLIGKLMRYCEILFICNAIFVLVGAVFELRIFRSYPFMDYRYGYNGVIPAVNESSFFYFIGLLYVYYKKYILNQKLGLLILVPISAFFLGTKAIYVLMAAIVLFHFIRVSTLKSRILAFFGLITFAALAFALYKSPYTQHIVDYFVHLVNRRGLLSAALSGRDVYVVTKFFDNLEFWTPLNYLFGGQDQMNYLIEMDIFDIFLFFGIAGSLVWFFLLFNTIFSFSLKKKFNLFFVFIYLILAGLGGHFFASAVNSLYLVIFCLFIYSNDKQNAQAAQRI
jgi:hypothetical protein